MRENVLSARRRGERFGIEDVAFDDFDVVDHGAEILSQSAREVVEDRNAITRPGKVRDDVRADEAGAAGNENRSGHQARPPRARLRATDHA